jgi:hypothetical protein
MSRLLIRHVLFDVRIQFKYSYGHSIHSKCEYKVKVKLCLCLITHKAMKTYWDGGITPRILDLGTRRR